ncbi:MAG TPA: membrane protein insertion efficiency factor YidD [Terracidiphilus sp.]|nr:membrane protein insertion efficiency factor YidD [Terracidiphilus sp.]
MPALRRRLLRPELWLAGILLLALLFAADAMRAPQRQVSVRAFAAGVAVYHRWVHPWTERFVRCRYRPTCSAYAVEAVREYGIVKGGWMSLRRVARCRQSVPMGTWDPVR